MFKFLKRPALKSLPISPVDRLIAAVDEFNAAMDELPPGTRLSPWVERRPGMRPLLTLTEYKPGASERLWPRTDADYIKGYNG